MKHRNMLDHEDEVKQALSNPDVVRPNQEHMCEETDDDVILMKDRECRVVGFEKLNFTPTGEGIPIVSFETMAVSK